MIVTRHKNANWRIGDANGQNISQEDAALAVQMDIRDVLLSIDTKLGCYRLPRALDALHSLGVAARRRRKRRTK